MPNEKKRPGVGLPLPAAPVVYTCEECDQQFWVHSDAPQRMEGFEDLAARPADVGGKGDPAWPRYGLSCPWCDGWADPCDPALRGRAGRHPHESPAAVRLRLARRPAADVGDEEEDDEGDDDA